MNVSNEKSQLEFFDNFMKNQNLKIGYFKTYSVGSFQGFTSNKLEIDTEIGLYCMDNDLNIYKSVKGSDGWELINKENEYDPRTNELTERFNRAEISEYEYNILLDELHSEYFNE